MLKAENNRRIAKNTGILYLRTILILVITLYTSRIVLNTLGIENYGIYDIIGGFVAFFSVVSATMVASTKRFLTFELGKKEGHSQEVFGAAMTIHIVLALILLLLFETVGLWFLNAKLNIAAERMHAANWVYQCSVLTFLINILSIPYNATIIAHEKMNVFAYINILEVTLKLLIVYFLLISPVDQLILYAVLVLCVAVFVRFIYGAYCLRHFPETRYMLIREKSYYKKISQFAGLNFLGASSYILAGQGINLLLNLFFGVTVNAARGIALQVEGAIMKFVNDFTTALNPQITKSYACEDKDYMMELVCRGSKYSFLLFLFLALPVMVETPLVLSIWLKEVPEYTVIFVRFSLSIAMLNTLSAPLTTCVLATGNIKAMSLWIGTVRLCVLPLAYLFLRWGYPPFIVYAVVLLTDMLLLFVRIGIVTKVVRYSAVFFMKTVILRLIPVLLLSGLSAVLLSRFIAADSFVGLVAFTVTCLCVTAGVVAYAGLNDTERTYVVTMVRSKWGKPKR